MYKHYFNLKAAPFSIAPDPRYLFMSERHREALAHLLYGVDGGGGFVLLTGEIGAGKTTVCRCFIEQIPAHCRLAYIFNPKLSVEELLASVCEEYHLAVAGTSLKAQVDAINAYLLECHGKGLNNVLIIDEAQNLAPAVLEQLRLLTNLETSERKLLQIVLIGQPELRGMVAAPELEQLAQRVIARYHLGSLSLAETGAYVQYRLTVAGAAASAPLPAGLMPLVHRLTGGVPRRINLLCDRALLGAYVENRPAVSASILRKAGAEVFGNEKPAGPRTWAYVLAALLAGAVISGAAAWQLLPRAGPSQALALAPVPAAAPKPVMPAPKPLPAAAPAPELAANLPLHVSADSALLELSGLWGQRLTGGDPCRAALQSGLRCHRAKGGMFDLRLLDRPAVLTLHEGTDLRYALLIALDGANATLLLDGQRHIVGIGNLAAQFDGEFVTMWKVPRYAREELRFGDQGEDVDALSAHLARANGGGAITAGRPFDAAMKVLVHDFQAAQQLKADGVAGPRTLMRLNQLAGVDEPRLTARK